MSAALTIVCLTTVRRRALAERAVAMFCTHHPEAHRRIIVVDDPVGANGIALVERAFANREFARLALLHTDATLMEAVRPTVLRWIVSEAAGIVVVLPDDAETFARLDVLARPTGAVVLCNTRFGPPPLDGKLPDAVDTTSIGRIDQDLFSMRADDQRALDFLGAWIACLVRSPHVGTQRLSATSFPWLDSLADLPGVECVTSTEFPLSVRNADEQKRTVTASLVRWPGFEAKTPWLLSAETGELPRVRPTTHPALARLARERAEALMLPPLADDEPLPAFTHLPNGMIVTNVIRHAYAVGLQRFESGNGGEPPNPFAGDANEAFITWLVSPVDGIGAAPLARSFRLLHPELSDSLQSDDDVVAWLNDRGPATGVPRELRPRRSSPSSRPSSTATAALSLRPAVEVSGYVDAAFGMGAAARVVAAACRASAIPTTVLVDTRTAHHQDASIDGPAWPASSGTPTPVLVLVRNADALLADPADAIAARKAGRKVVGMWFWEVDTFPDRLRPAFALLDEIWVATEFVAQSLRAHSDAPPVHLFPFPLPPPVELGSVRSLAQAFSHEYDIDDDRFVVAFSFDFDSVADRKNPWGAVAAYKLAFPVAHEALPDGRRPYLVLKAIGSDRHPIDHDRLVFSIDGRSDVLLIEDHLDADGQAGFFCRADAYISLHRGEGLGLTVAEAMAAGTPVVVTNYGGTTSFCDADTAWLVPFGLIDIPPSTPVYAGCGQWAEPDVAVAATYLRSIATTDEPAKTMTCNATEQLRVRGTATDGSTPAFITERVLHLVGAQAAIVETATNVAIDEPILETTVPTLEPVPPSSAESSPAESVTPPGLGPVVLPGAAPTERHIAGGMLGAVTERVRATVEPMIAAQATFEQARVVALVEAVQQTRQAVLDLETNARAERQTLTDVIGGVQSHLSNVQSNHDALYATVTELSTSTREAAMGQVDLHDAVTRIDARLDDITRQLSAILNRL